MNTVSIPVTLKYSGNLSPAEKSPQIKCFLDARFNREAVTIQLDKPERSLYSAVVKGETSAASIPPTAALCFASMAWRPNEFDSPCLLDTGVTHVTLYEVAQEIVKKGKFERTMQLCMNTAQGLCKGTIDISISKMDGIDLKMPPLVGDAKALDAVPLISQYINETMETEQNMRDTFNGTENMRIPFDYSESGIQSTNGNPLPAVAFVMAETPKTNTKYWENAFETIMKRDDLLPEQWDRLNTAGKARATVLTVAYAAHYFDYVSDTVDRNTRFQQYMQSNVQAYENFGDALAMQGSGDCEDLGSVIAQSLQAFKVHKFEGETRFPPLLEMQKIARNYIPPLSLDVVRGAQVSDDVEHYGAHMNDNFIPISTFEKWMSGTRDGRQLLKQLPATPDKMSEPLPFLVGEGTGMYEPYGYDNPLLPIMSYVYRAQSLAPFKKPILHKKGEPGSFFVGSLVGMTDCYYKLGSTAPLSFWYCTKQKDGSLTRGTSYTDMMNDSPNVVLKPQPMLTRQIMGSVEEAVLRRVPPDSLILTSSHPSRAKHTILQKISDSVKQLNRAPGSPHQKANVFIRPHQINSTIGNRIISDMKQMDRIWKVDYHLEEITDKMWGYRVEFFVR